MRILVTGGAGFVGSNLVRALVHQGHEVVLFDNLCATYSLTLVDDVANQLRFVHGDVRAPEDLERIGTDGFDRVYHLAASFANELSVESPLRDLRTNAEGTAHVLAYAQRVGCKLFVYTGSSSSYGDAPLPLEEDGPMFPRTPYASSKLQGEQFVRVSPIPFSVFRLFNVYGPGDTPGRYRNAIPNMLAALDPPNGKIRIYGEDATRDFTFVEDVVGVLCEAERAVGHTVNVGTGTEVSVLGLARAMLDLAGRREDGLSLEPRRNWDRVPRRQAEVSRLRTLFGRVPSTPVSEGLRRTATWLADRGYIGRWPGFAT